MADLLLNLSANVIALVALVLAYISYRATAEIWLRLIEVNGGAKSSADEHDWDMFDYFTVVIQNDGLPLHDVSVWLCFDTVDDGTNRFQMPRVQYAKTHKGVDGPSDLAQGMAARYMLKSYQIREHGKKLLAEIDGVRRRNARLIVCAQDHRVFEFRLWQRFYGVKGWLNRMAYWINSCFDRVHITKDGRELHKEGSIIPTFNTESQFRTECFIEAFQREESRETKSPPVPETKV